MNYKQHLVQGGIFSAALTPWLGSDSLLVLLSMVLIDIDHYFDYVLVCRRFGLKDMFRFHDWLWQNRETVYAISLFHTIEVFLLLFCLGFWNYRFWLILSGFCLHYLFDLYYLYRHDSVCIRAFSIIEYLLRKGRHKGYPSPAAAFRGSRQKTKVK